jgi:2-polyprenyl-3-methyl-5-hydroxy-6-metoxy-1,4-benzoquinol methylase
MEDKNKNSVESHYDISAEDYHLQYERDLLYDLDRVYPANYHRVHLLLNSFLNSDVKTIVEVGVGEGTPLITMQKAGYEVAGFDVSRKMVSKCKENFKNNGLNSENIIWGDINDPITYSPLLRNGKFDGLLAMGVLPHVKNDEYVLNNMKSMVNEGGKVFIEFRNKLFSLFTFNRKTKEFILNELLEGVDEKLKEIVSEDLDKRLELNEPTLRESGESANLKDGNNSSGPGYDTILSKFHNPFEVKELFLKCGFKDPKFLWYHYHPSMPYLEKGNEQLFRKESLNLEHENSSWKGFFLCSAFVIEATV